MWGKIEKARKRRSRKMPREYSEEQIKHNFERRQSGAGGSIFLTIPKVWEILADLIWRKNMKSGGGKKG
jgi:hypothetical protein